MCQWSRWHTIICGALEREKKICPWKSSGYTTGVHPFLSQKHSLLYTECCDLDHSPRVLCYRVSPFPFLQLQYLQAWMLPCTTTTTTTCVSSQTLRVQYPTQHILEYWIGNPLPLPEKQHSVLLLCTFKKHTYSWCTLQSANYTLPANYAVIQSNNIKCESTTTTRVKTFLRE